MKRLITGVYAVGQMRKSHELLLKCRFDPRYTFSKIRVWYVDRGAPGDRSPVCGDDILTLESYYLEIASDAGMKRIPYHRIRKILYDGEVIWER